MNGECPIFTKQRETPRSLIPIIGEDHEKESSISLRQSE